MKRNRCLTAALLALLAAGAQGQEQAGDDFFERRIRPLLAAHCYECHGAEKQESDLRLDRFADLRSGGASGRALVPGKPQASLLVTAVRYIDAELQMPPSGKLSEPLIADLVRWIEMGAPHPDVDLASGTGKPPTSADWGEGNAADHWAFQPPVKPALPDVSDKSWPQTPVDLFVLSKLEAEGIAPAPPAEPRTMLRRTTFDLTGLPPSPEELAEFERRIAHWKKVNPSESDDRSVQLAVAELVDRLLASPHYGERWGRHWLDVARYADSNGLDENVAHGNAWRYRDWVIGALNDDKPYDEFVREQIAGDLLLASDVPSAGEATAPKSISQQDRLLPHATNDRLIATGFLSLGPKVLAEVDKQKMEMDIIDEQIDAVGRALLGLTLGCARCHDHKFDPITSTDYYALAGIFKSTKTMESLQTIARWHENELYSGEYERAKAEYEQRLGAKQQLLREMAAAATAELMRELGEEAPLPAEPEMSFPQETRDALQRLREEITSIEKNAPSPPTAMGVREAQPEDVPLHIRGSHLTLGESVPRGFPRILLGDGPGNIDPQQSGRLELADWLTTAHHPLTARVMVNRIWRWHFGRGLVETTDNFGRLGAAPANPELLDWLAVEFVQSGWSIKHVHRLIMLSATYQTASHARNEAAMADPENRLWGRTSVRRLEAEEIRDGLLAAAGVLDTTMGGSLLGIENRQHIFDHTSKDGTSYASGRRSVYLPVVRNHLHDAFTLFDYNDASVPTGNRGSSTAASQALYLMNSEFMAGVSQHLAERLLALPVDSDEARLQTLYQLAFTRHAQEEEVRRAEAYLQRFQGQLQEFDQSGSRVSHRKQAWRLLCQAALMSNEFLYVR